MLFKFIVKRLLYMLLSLFALITILFFLFRILPGDPVSMYIDAGMSKEAKAALMRQFGLDKPLMEQYIIYIGNIAKGDFGTSFRYGSSTLAIVMGRFWSTFILMGTSLIIAFTIGIIGGALMAWYRGTSFEMIGISIILAIRSAPVFWVGMVALSIFAFKLDLLPLGGMHTPGTYFSSTFEKFFNLDFLKHLILPACVASLNSIATPLLVMRTSMLEIIKEDFIELAKAKGLSNNRIIFKHAVRNATLPVITVLAVQAGLAIGGVVLVETVFRWPGMGREIVLAVAGRDYPLAQTAFFLIGVLTIIFNLISDILYAVLDPRVAHDS